MKVLKLIVAILLILNIEARLCKIIQLYTDDKRCNEIGICSDMNYGDKRTVVTFKHKPKIRLTSYTTYDVREEQKVFYTLTFVKSKFANFPLKLFEAFHIHELDLRNCTLNTLNKNNFENANSLNMLLLSNNNLKKIHKETFSQAKNLNYLLLDTNRISVLYNESFKGLESLRYLDLHDNLIETLPLYIFAYMPELQQINLSKNRLKIIERDLFYYNPVLFSLNLQHNSLKEIQDYAFQNQDLKYLDISFNNHLEIFESTSLRVDNLWAKHCSLRRINIYGQVIQADFQYNFIKELYFSQPEYLESLNLKHNDLEQLSTLSQANNLKILNVCHNSKLKDLNDLKAVYDLERLDVSNCSLSQIPLQFLENASSLKTLNISFNNITEININYLKYLKKLSRFYLHHNNWNCYNLKQIMDLLIKPNRISYTKDTQEENSQQFGQNYIRGIKCIDRKDLENEREYYMDLNAANNISSAMEWSYNITNFENVSDLKQLHADFEVIKAIYEQKFSLILNKLEELNIRFEQFESFNNNENLWQKASVAF